VLHCLYFSLSFSLLHLFWPTRFNSATKCECEFAAQLKKSSVFSFVESANRTKSEHLQNYPGGNSAQESFVYFKKSASRRRKVFLFVGLNSVHRHHLFKFQFSVRKKFPTGIHFTTWERNLRESFQQLSHFTVVYNIFFWRRINIYNNSPGLLLVKCVFVYRPSSRERLVARADYNQPPSLSRSTLSDI
jgi:hypothetical protein